MTKNINLEKEARRLAEQLFGSDSQGSVRFTERLLGICARVRDKDLLLIHNPGGFGSTPLEHCLQWERSIMEGVCAALQRLGHNPVLTQYFRTGHSWWAHIKDLREQARFFFKGEMTRVGVMVAEVGFLTQHFDNLKIVLIGASQGAAFSNAVMRQLGELGQVYSIELGIFFPHVERRVVTKRTLVIDSNGVMPDPMVHQNLKNGAKAYLLAPLRWVKYRLEGQPQTFANCLCTPGHNYSWEYPEVRRKVEDFLALNFSTKSNLEVGKL